MRYSDTTLTFWATVQKLFKGKGVNFFRGFKGQGLVRDREDAIDPEECSINFAVPSDPTLRGFTSQFNMDLLHPGVMHTPLDAYSDAFPDTNVKLSMDEKTWHLELEMRVKKTCVGMSHHPP